MKFSLTLGAFFASMLLSFGGVSIDEAAFGKSLGGWKKRVVDYSLSGADYRTYKPEISPTPDGGIFVSVRIDNVRGWLSSNDHAVLEITVNSKGGIVSAQSNIAIQGRSITSDVIVGATEAGKAILTPEFAVQVGADLVANLSAKLLRENIVEAGRVSFPAVLRHNFNHLFQAIRVDSAPPAPMVTPVETPKPEPATPEKPPVKPEEKEAKPTTIPLEIKPYQ